MFKKECIVMGKADIDKVWGLYANVSKWNEWDKSIDKVVLNGDFKNGATGTMFFIKKDVPPLSFALKDIIEKERFITIAEFADIYVEHDHGIVTSSNGEISIQHSITVQGTNENMVQGIGASIATNLEESMKAILVLSS